MSLWLQAHPLISSTVALVITLILVFIYDITQTKHAIRRNFPVIGIARYLLELIGPELRQYLFHDERSDRPIPRYIRTWIYASAKGQLATVAFGTKKDLDKPGTTLIRHSAFPINYQESDCDVEHRVLIGSQRRHPYNTSLFNVSAMSFGALGKNAVLALSHGAKAGGFALNTGEGGVSPYHYEGGADLIAQMGTAKFGFRDEHGDFSEDSFLDIARNAQVKMIEIKLSQGAKPGKGGVLPKEKITPEIAQIRGVSMDQSVYSPPRHKDWDDEEGMLKFIARLQDLGGKPIGLKFCLGREEFVHNLIKAMLKTGIKPDYIAIDGAEGATGAAPLAHTDYVGYPLKDALMFLDNQLRIAGLRDEVKICASAKVFTGADLAIMLALGADFCASARGFMLSIGCIHALKCNTNHCPAGVATHDPWLQRGLVVEEKTPRVASYHRAVIHEANSLMFACGYTHPSQFKRSDVIKVVDYHKIIGMDEIIPQPPKQACSSS